MTSSEQFVRAFPLDDIQIRAGGDGRTVEAYCAVFDTPTEIHDQQGHYREQLARTAFNKTIADNGCRFGVFFNHARTLMGTPSDLGSVPIGSPVEAPRVDARGVFTVSRYNKSALADSVLESIRNGDITGQSFSGRFVASSPALPRGGYRAAGDGSLPLVTRSEIAMREYGPTPIPAYDVPMVVGVRSLGAAAGRARALATVHDHYAARADLTPDDRANLTLLLAQLAAADGAVDPIVQALCAGNVALDNAMVVISAMLAVPNPDLDDASEDPEDIPVDSTQAPVPAYASGRRPGTGIPPAAPVEPLRHSGRSVAQRVRAGLIVRGIAS